MGEEYKQKIYELLEQISEVKILKYIYTLLKAFVEE